MSIFSAELIGTMILIILGDGVVAGVLLNKSKAQNGGWVVITLGWGFAVAMAVYAVGRFSGAHINPAVTVALAASGKLAWSKVPEYLAGQFAGAIAGAIVVYLHYLPHWKITEDPGLKLAVFSTGPAVRNPASNLLSEIIGTAVLLFGVLAIGANFGAGVMNDAGLRTAFGTALPPLLVGFLVLSIGLSLGGPTGYAINPARDLGPRIAHFILPIPGKGSSDWSYAWIPVIGPLIGGTLGALAWKALVS
jgi:glycerol uptake facilitator protein